MTLSDYHAEAERREARLDDLAQVLTSEHCRWMLQQILRHGSATTQQWRLEFPDHADNYTVRLRPLTRMGICAVRRVTAQRMDGGRPGGTGVYTLTERGAAALADLRALLSPELEAHHDEPA